MIIVYSEDDYRLTEMSMAKDKQEIYYPQFFMKKLEHLLKIYYFRNSPSVNTWKKHLYGNTPTAPLFRHNNKLPSFEFIFKHLWLTYADQFFNLYKILMSDILKMKYVDTGKVRKNPNMKDVKTFCENVFDWVAHELAKKGAVNKSAYYGVVDSFLLRHPY